MRTHKLCESLVDSKQLGDIHIISDQNKWVTKVHACARVCLSCEALIIIHVLHIRGNFCQVKIFSEIFSVLCIY